MGVTLADLTTDPIDADRVTFIRGNPSNAEDLGRAGVERARTAIVLSDQSSGVTDPDDLACTPHRSSSAARSETH